MRTREILWSLIVLGAFVAVLLTFAGCAITRPTSTICPPGQIWYTPDTALVVPAPTGRVSTDAIMLITPVITLTDTLIGARCVESGVQCADDATRVYCQPLRSLDDAPADL